MTNERGASVIEFVCDECGARHRYVLERKQVRERRGLFSFGLRGHRFESSTPPWVPQQYQQAIAPPVASTGGALGPGEHVWRPMDLRADVAAPLRYALVWGGEIVVLVGSIALAIELRSWWPLLITTGDVAVGIVYGLVTLPILKADGAALLARSRDAESVPQEQVQGKYAVEGTLEVAPGKYRYLHLEVTNRDAAVAWHRFCKDVTFNGKNFSENQAVKRNGLPPDDWVDILAEFVKRDYVIPASKPRETPRLKGQGRAWVSMYAHNPPD